MLKRTNFNLLVTYEYGVHNYRFATSILRNIIGDFIVVDYYQSVILIKTRDPYEAVTKLKSRLNELSVIYRVIPVDLVLDPYVEVVKEHATELALKRIPVDKSFKVILNGRLYWRETRMPAHTRDAVLAIAEGINRKVSLLNPDYIVYIRSLKSPHTRRVATLTVTESSNIISLKSGKP